MPCGLLVDGIDHVEGGLGKMSAGCPGIGPDGKELATEIAGTRLIETDVADVFGIAVADIKILVQKTSRRVGMGIHNNRRVVNGASTRADGLAKGKRRRQHDDQGKSEIVHRGLLETARKGFYTVGR